MCWSSYAACIMSRRNLNSGDCAGKRIGKGAEGEVFIGRSNDPDDDHQ